MTAHTGTMEYTWEEVTMGMGLTEASRDWEITLKIDYYAPPYRRARINCDPEDSYPAEGGGIIVEEVRVTRIKHGELVVPLTKAHAHYWASRFEREMLKDGSFCQELLDAVDDEPTEEYDDTEDWTEAQSRWRK